MNQDQGYELAKAIFYQYGVDDPRFTITSMLAGSGSAEVRLTRGRDVFCSVWGELPPSATQHERRRAIEEFLWDLVGRALTEEEKAAYEEGVASGEMQARWEALLP